MMTITLFRAALAASTLLALPAAASAQVNEQPPIGEPVAFSLPETRSFSLDNGLDVTFIPYGLTPTTLISVQVRAGNIDDGADTYIADLAAAMMEEGAAGRSAQDIATEIASMGGSVSASVGWHSTGFTTSVLSEYAPEALAILGDVVRNPNMPSSEFERVRANLARDVSVSRAQPGPIATEAYREILYGTDHPYGNSLPSEEQVRAYTLDDATGFYAANFGAQRTRIYVAGQFDEAVMEAAIRDAFGDWDAGPEDMITPASPSGGPVVHLIDRPDAPQSTLRLGFPTVDVHHEDAIDLSVMNALLGGSFTSRLVANLREDKGFTYSPGSSASWSMGGGFWTFNADINTGDTRAALVETFGEITRLQDTPPPAEEGDGIRNWMSGVFILQNASASGLVGQLSFRDTYDLPADYLDTYVPAVNAVTDADISRVAETYLDLDNLVLVIVGDLASIEDDVRSLPELAGAQFVIAGE